MLNTETISFDAYFDDLTTAIPANEAASGYSVYPNPAKDVLYIRNHEQSTGIIQYKVVDIQGKVVMEGILNGKSTVNEIRINSLQPSVYLLKISNSDSEDINIRFIKMGY